MVVRPTFAASTEYVYLRCSGGIPSLSWICVQSKNNTIVRNNSKNTYFEILTFVLMFSIVSVASQSSVIVLPVNVFTKILWENNSVSKNTTSQKLVKYGEVSNLLHPVVGGIDMKKTNIYIL